VNDEKKQNSGPPGESNSRPAPSDSASVPDDVHQDTVANSAGAYLLNALPEAERAEFEAFVETSPETRAELAYLAPAAASLASLLDLDETANQQLPAPAPGRRVALMAAVHEEIAAANAGRTARPARPERAKTIRTAPLDNDQIGSSRSREGLTATPARGDRRIPSSITTLLSTGWLAAAALLVVAVGSIFWALALQGRLDSKEREIRAQSQEIAQLRQSGTAATYTLAANGPAPASAGGTLLFSLKDQIGILYVHNLPALDADHVYQLWYLNDDLDAPVPGDVFTVNSDGSGMVLVPSDTPNHDGIALTEEPAGGSVSPTSAVILFGNLNGTQV
jgi:Anti-sigma-K factor rskA